MMLSAAPIVIDHVQPGIAFPSIKRVRRIDIAGVVEAIKDNPSLWTDNTFRQTATRTAHRDTETIYLHAPASIEGRALVDVVPTVDHRGAEIPALAAFLARIRAAHKWPLARLMIVNLKPGGRIVQHSDGGDFADATERFHAPLLTNPWAWLRSGTDTVNLRAGVLYWVNKHIPHEGANEGSTPRWHAIADYYR